MEGLPGKSKRICKKKEGRSRGEGCRQDIRYLISLRHFS